MRVPPAKMPFEEPLAAYDFLDNPTPHNHPARAACPAPTPPPNPQPLPHLRLRPPRKHTRSLTGMQDASQIAIGRMERRHEAMAAQYPSRVIGACLCSHPAALRARKIRRGFLFVVVACFEACFFLGILRHSDPPTGSVDLVLLLILSYLGYPYAQRYFIEKRGARWRARGSVLSLRLRPPRLHAGDRCPECRTVSTQIAGTWL